MSVFLIALLGCGRGEIPLSVQTVIVTATVEQSDMPSMSPLPQPKIIEGSLLAKFAVRIDEIEGCRNVSPELQSWLCSMGLLGKIELLEDMGTIIRTRSDSDRYSFVVEALSRANAAMDEGLRRGCIPDEDYSPTVDPERGLVTPKCHLAFVDAELVYIQVIRHLVLIDTQ